MASIVDKIRDFLRSPKGQQVMEKAKDPRNQQKVKDMINKRKQR